MKHLLKSTSRGAGLLACLMAVTMPVASRAGANRPQMRSLSGRTNSTAPGGTPSRLKDFGPKETGDARTTDAVGIALSPIRGSFAPPSLLEAPAGLLEGGVQGKGEFWTSPNKFQHGGSGAKGAAPEPGKGSAAARASAYALEEPAAAKESQAEAGCVVGASGCPGGQSDGAVQTPTPVSVPTPDIAPAPDIAPPSVTAPAPVAVTMPDTKPAPVPTPAPDMPDIALTPEPAPDIAALPLPAPTLAADMGQEISPPPSLPDVPFYDPVIPEVGDGCAMGSPGCMAIGDPPAPMADVPLPYVEQPILVAGGTFGPTLLPPGSVPEPQLRVLDPVTETAAYNFARVKELTGKARTVGLSEAEIAELRALMGEIRIQEMGVGWDFLVQKARTEYARRNP